MKRGLLIMALCLTSRAASAECQCPPLSTKEQMEHATYVFTADIWDVAFDRPNGGRKVVTFDVIDTYKGAPASRVEVKEEEEGGKECGIDFHEGESYMVYARWRWGTTSTARCWGTKRLDQVGAESGDLGPGRAAKNKYYDKLHMVCLGRRDTTCCTASVKAMRDHGFLPQSDEGCPDDMVPDRLRCDGSYVWCVPSTDASRHNQK